MCVGCVPLMQEITNKFPHQGLDITKHIILCHVSFLCLPSVCVCPFIESEIYFFTNTDTVKNVNKII